MLSCIHFIGSLHFTSLTFHSTWTIMLLWCKCSCNLCLQTQYILPTEINYKNNCDYQFLGTGTIQLTLEKPTAFLKSNVKLVKPNISNRCKNYTFSKSIFTNILYKTLYNYLYHKKCKTLTLPKLGSRNILHRNSTG